jgi:hypothetical protein
MVAGALDKGVWADRIVPTVQFNLLLWSTVGGIDPSHMVYRDQVIIDSVHD